MYETEMPLDAEELTELSDEAWALLETIRQITAPDSDRGRRVSGPEGRQLLRSATALAAQLALDLID